MNVISCSRRTDIPHRHAGWLYQRLLEGYAEWKAPRGTDRSVPLLPADVHSIVFWSKDYGPLLRDPRLTDLIQPLNPYFHLTVTGLGGGLCEPGIPAWREASAQIGRLQSIFGEGRVSWRFDPILHWLEGGLARSNLELFPAIGAAAAGAGLRACTFSFAQHYRKVRLRSLKTGIELVDPDPGEKLRLAGLLAAQAAELGLELKSCADSSWVSVDGVATASCIDGEMLNRLRGDGQKASLARDCSQRQECGCTKSIDIGSYTQRCVKPACVYCYAK